MNAGIISAFKRHYRHYHLQNALDRDERGKLDLYKVDQLPAIRWSLAAWDEITTRTIANGFRHTGLFNKDGQQGAAQAEADDLDDQTVGQKLQAAIDQLSLRNPMSIDNLLYLVEKDETAHSQLTANEILAYV
jgi:hypothetical protein